MAKRKGGKKFRKAPLAVLENAAFKLTKLVERRGGTVRARTKGEMSKSAKAEYNR